MGEVSSPDPFHPSPPSLLTIPKSWHDHMSGDYEDVLRITVSVVAAVIFVIALLAYRRRPTTRTLLLLIAFGVYVVKGAFLSLEFFMAEQAGFWEYMAIVADVLFLVLIGTAFLKR